jgi:hypothetical protein
VTGPADVRTEIAGKPRELAQLAGAKTEASVVRIVPGAPETSAFAIVDMCSPIRHQRDRAKKPKNRPPTTSDHHDGAESDHHSGRRSFSSWPSRRKKKWSCLLEEML